jgi:hypothetical protein
VVRKRARIQLVGNWGWIFVSQLHTDQSRLRCQLATFIGRQQQKVRSISPSSLLRRFWRRGSGSNRRIKVLQFFTPRLNP